MLAHSLLLCFLPISLPLSFSRTCFVEAVTTIDFGDRDRRAEQRKGGKERQELVSPHVGTFRAPLVSSWRPPPKKGSQISPRGKKWLWAWWALDFSDDFFVDSWWAHTLTRAKALIKYTSLCVFVFFWLCSSKSEVIKISFGKDWPRRRRCPFWSRRKLVRRC